MLKIAREIRFVIYARDFYSLKDFYTNILGLKVIKEWDHGEQARGLTCALGAAQLEILETADAPRAGDSYIYVEVEDATELRNKLQGRAEICEELADQPWGHRNFSVLDPGGNKIKFFSLI